ncbi:hypothetical protein BC833DRAFT_357656 [Globomyces pollinis-pini]|nr:hypothetical protein BC833DRAFT_357656 [Globomyces pollinis-pini]
MVNLYQLSGAMLFCGVCFTQSCQSLIQYGISFNIFQDKSRQIFLNLLCFLSVFFFIVYYYTNQSADYPRVNDICLLAFNIFIQYGLVILVHNSIVKLASGVNKTANFFNTMTKYFAVVYILPIIPLSFIVMAIQDAHDKDILARKSHFNTQYYKPMSVVLILIVNLIASVADYILMNRVIALTERVNSSQNNSNYSTRKVKAHGSHSLSLKATYNIITVLVLIDVVMKVLVILDYPVFDSVVTVTSLTFRSAANLKFGVTLKNIYRPDSSEEDTYGTRAKSIEQSRANSHHSRYTTQSVNVFSNN